MPTPKKNPVTIIKKSNDVIRASYRLSLQEMRLLALVVLDFKDNQKHYEVSATRFCDVYSLSMTNAYDDLKEAGLRLFDRTFIEERLNGKKLLRWVETLEYKNDSGKVELKIAEDFMAYMQELKKNFTLMDFEEVKQFRSVHTARIYELLKSYQYKKEVVQSVEEIKALLGLGAEYSQNNIQEKILKPARKEINRIASVNVDFEPVKLGRKVVSYRFTIEEKPEAPEPKKQPKKIRVPGLAGIERQLFMKVKVFNPELQESEVLKQANPLAYLQELLLKVD